MYHVILGAAVFVAAALLVVGVRALACSGWKIWHDFEREELPYRSIYGKPKYNDEWGLHVVEYDAYMRRCQRCDKREIFDDYEKKEIHTYEESNTYIGERISGE